MALPFYSECNYAEGHVLFIVMLNANKLSVVMLSVVAPAFDLFVEGVPLTQLERLLHFV
jgi:hypothetical protein